MGKKLKWAMAKTICFFNSNRAWGGGEKWHFTTAKDFERRGFSSLLVTNVGSELSKRALQERMKFYTFSIGNLSFLNPLKIFTMAAFFKSHGVEAVILNLPADLKLAGMAAKLAGIKTIVYRRGMPHPLRNTWLNRFLFRTILTHVVVNSEEIGRSLQLGNEEWFPKNKMLLIYNGVNPAVTFDRNQKLYAKAGNEVVIGNVGRLTEQKGQKYLIEMARRLKQKGLNFKLLIAGEGELKADLQRQIEAAKLTGSITLMGHVSDIPAFMNSLDVFVFPSLFEGSANTLIETLQMGIPCVAFDVSSNPEIIHHGINGFLARPFDVDELTRYVLELVQHQEKAQLFAMEGERILRQKFDSSKNLDLLQHILK
jgi:glycosyltransferase involved in cell wall biosynthesis